MTARVFASRHQGGAATLTRFRSRSVIVSAAAKIKGRAVKPAEEKPSDWDNSCFNLAYLPAQFEKDDFKNAALMLRAAARYERE